MDKIIGQKRGRKPKNKNIETPVIEKKKRGRKPSCQIFELKELDTMINNLPEECVIAHLPLCHSDIEEYITNIDEKDENLHKINFSIDNEIINNNFIQCEECKILNEKINLLTEQLNNSNNSINNNNDYEKNIKVNSIRLEETNNKIICWWCCHDFNNIPLGLPFKYYNDIFYVYGYFCSFNCSLAYNYSLNDYNIWERTSLLYNYRNKILSNINDIIRCAPPREALTIFGGSLSISEFRDNTLSLQKNYRLILPIAITLTATVEEYSDNINDKYIYDKQEDSNSLVLKRSKPVLKNKKSLITLMNIS
jgi:hypothetical protein